jgi:hypothetical protein
MQCTFVGIFEEERLIATALIQEIDLALLTSFGERDSFFLTQLRNFLFRQFASKLVIVGNNMLSGQNAYACLPTINQIKVLEQLREITQFWPKKTHLSLFKDFNEEQVKPFQTSSFENDFPFSSQPNMVVEIRPTWKNEGDYVGDLTKKYRDQFKRCRKKGSEISTKELSLQEIIKNEESIHSLYLHVAKNAPLIPLYYLRAIFQFLKNSWEMTLFYVVIILIGS